MDGVPGQEKAVGPFEDVLGMGRRTCIVGVCFSCSLCARINSVYIGFCFSHTVCFMSFVYTPSVHLRPLYKVGSKRFWKIHQATAMALALAVLLTKNAKEAFSFAFLRIRRPFLPFDFLFCLFHRGAHHTIRDHDPVTRLRRMIR